jgi:hypothetical protein
MKAITTAKGQGMARSNSTPRLRRAAALAAMSLLAVGLGGVAPLSASANGGVDITGWCRRYYNSGAFNAVVVTYNVYGWRCQYGSDVGTRLNVDMNAACAYTWPGRPGSARFTNFNNPYSWYCVF